MELTGKTAIVTGSNTGLGFETALDLYKYWGPDGPNEQKGKPALAKIDSVALNEKLNAKLWNWAKEVTNANFPF